MDLLDPTLDVVFKLLLLRERLLLIDMLQGVLARPMASPTILNPAILGEHVRDKQITLDLRIALPDGSRADLEMQRRTPANLASRLIYYGSRDYSDQLVRGNDYSQLAGTSVIAWLVRPLLPKLRRLHSVFELRERHTGMRLSGHLSFHLLQLSYRASSSSPASRPTSRYDAQVDRWARFLTARTHAELERLASESRIMSLAKHTLVQLSQDPDASRLARDREDAIKLYKDELAVTRARAEISGLRKGRKEGRDQGRKEGRDQGRKEGRDQGRKEGRDQGRKEGRDQGRKEGRDQGRKEGRDQGRKEGRVEILLEQLSLRFGRLSSTARAHVRAATTEQLDAWAKRVLTARTLDEVLAR